MFKWYEIPGALVFLTSWLGVALLLLAMLPFVLAVISGAMKDRVCACITILFLATEVVLLSILFKQPNIPQWYERLFVFNGFALPVQILCAAGVFFTKGLDRSQWLMLGSVPGIAFTLLLIATQMLGFLK